MPWYILPMQALLICNLIIALLQKCYAQLSDVDKLLSGLRIYNFEMWHPCCVLNQNTQSECEAVETQLYLLSIASDGG